MFRINYIEVVVSDGKETEIPRSIEVETEEMAKWMVSDAWKATTCDAKGKKYYKDFSYERT